MLVTSEGAKIRKKKEDDERRALMAAGVAKIEAMLAGRIADREAVEKINKDLKAVNNRN